METVDDEVTAAAIAFMEKAVAEGTPFFVWWNSTRMHIFTHLSDEWEGKTGLGIYADGMVSSMTTTWASFSTPSTGSASPTTPS